MNNKISILIAKPGLDGHDRGAKVIARALINAGFDVTYTGIRHTPEQIVEIAVRKNVDFVGLSLLSGAHNTLFPRVVNLLREKGMHNVIVFGGGVIPAEDIPGLKANGIAEVFTPGTPTTATIQFVNSFHK
jgi:methylmalonyl-CoA mutase C-terminal domain/subunit